MELRRQIEQAFGHRPKPIKVIEERSPVTPEQRDALQFAGIDWQKVGWQNWEHHPDAFYAFLPEAFIYYLPSVLISALDAPSGQLQAAQALLGVLNRSPEAYHWDAFITKRLFGLEPEEYEAIKAWLIAESGQAHMVTEDELARAYETVDLLARETDRVRRLIGR